MLRPGSQSRPSGESPVRVGTGAPGSRPRFVVERRRAERGVDSLFNTVGNSIPAAINSPSQPAGALSFIRTQSLGRRSAHLPAGCPSPSLPQADPLTLIRGMGNRAHRHRAPDYQ
jgi:hypothetical protein